MITLSASYADYGSGPLAEVIAWIDWANAFLDIDTKLTDIRVPLDNGLTLTFDIENTTLLGNGYALNPTPVTVASSTFGTLNYTGIPGNAAYQIYSMYPTESTTKVTLSNIRVTNASCNPIKNFAFVISNIETATDLNVPIKESQIYSSDGSIWRLLTWVGDTTNPSYSGIDTKIVTTAGNNPSDTTTSTGAPVLITENPTTLTIDITSTVGIQALSLGIYIIPCQIKRGVNLFNKKKS